MDFDLSQLPANRESAIRSLALVGGGLIDSNKGLRLARQLVDRDSARDLARRLANSPEGRGLATALVQSAAGRTLAVELVESRAGRALAMELIDSAALRALGRELAAGSAVLEVAGGLVASSAGRGLVGEVASSPAGRELALDLVNSTASLALTRAFANSKAGQRLVSDLITTDAGRHLVTALLRSSAVQELVRVLPASAESLDLAWELAKGEVGLSVARQLVGTEGGTGLLLDIAYSPVGERFAQALADSGATQLLAWDPTVASRTDLKVPSAPVVPLLLLLAAILALWILVVGGMGTLVVWSAAVLAEAGEPSRSESRPAEGDDTEAPGGTPPGTDPESSTHELEPASVRELLPAGVELIERLHGRGAVDLRKSLEPLIKLATEMIDEGKFQGDPRREGMITSRRNHLQSELWSDPDIPLNTAIVVSVATAIMEDILPALPQGRDTEIAANVVRPVAGGEVTDDEGIVASADAIVDSIDASKLPDLASGDLTAPLPYHLPWLERWSCSDNRYGNNDPGRPGTHGTTGRAGWRDRWSIVLRLSS